MIKAIIENGDDILLLDLPYNRYTVGEDLANIGFRGNPNDLFIRDDDEQPISVKLFTDDFTEGYLLTLFNRDTSLSTANTVCDLVKGLSPAEQGELALNLENHKYSTVQDLFDGIKDISAPLRKTEAAPYTLHFYCPLTVRMYEDDDSGQVEVSNDFLGYHEEEIRNALEADAARDGDMSQYFDGSTDLREKLISIRWDVENVQNEIYGFIHIDLTAPPTEDEKEELRDFVLGQNSDGLGEGFEQHPVRTADGDLYISFWESGNDYFLLDDEEFERHLGSQQMGGIE